MGTIEEKIRNLGLDVSELNIYVMHKINFGMKVDNQIKPIYIEHIPTKITVKKGKYKSHHKNLIEGLEEIKNDIGL